MKCPGALDDPIMLSGHVVVPRGAGVVLVASTGQQGGKFKGSDVVELKVDSISAKGRFMPVVTPQSQTKSAGEGKKSTRKILGGAGLGAAIGGIAGGGTGAAIGALTGAAAGTIGAGTTGKRDIEVPAEAALSFKLTHSLTLKPA